MCGRKRECMPTLPSYALCVTHFLSYPQPRPDQNTHIMQTLQIQKTASHAISTRNQTYRKLEADDIMQNCLRSRYLNPFCIFIINIIFRPEQTHIYNRACLIYYQETYFLQKDMFVSHIWSTSHFLTSIWTKYERKLFFTWSQTKSY